MSRLVVVESPTKARTIRRFLPDGYQVEASMGHVRDLPSSASQIPDRVKKEKWSRLGVNVENGFEPLYIIPPDKSKVVRALKDALKDADELFIATDEDREGESIGWHLLEVLKPKIPVRRMVFHEITREAIEAALVNTREMDRSLINAQETRRILDRLVGYSISPLLWKKIAPRLSAGRVQSVAVRAIVNRETERIHFVPASYWDLAAKLQQAGGAFDATLTQLDGIRVVTGRDFDDETGRLKANLVDGKDVVQVGAERAKALAASLPSAPWKVVRVDEKQIRRSPSAPFITSSLQQEASRKLRMSARDTMRTAQKLYEQGFITYMRTDSTNLSKEAIEASRKAVETRYGSDYLPKSPRTYTSKVRNAQEAHEAIRPAGTAMKSREELNLKGAEGDLYELIWKRTVASQMNDARLRTVAVHIDAVDENGTATFRASGRTVEFPGFFRAYVEGSDDPEAALEDRESPLPALAEGDTPTCKGVEAEGHETRPPSRLSDASLIQFLEKEGIGRPSTYASIIDTIVGRGYVRRQGSQLIPSFTAFATNRLLVENFGQLVDSGFTAEMEGVLDEIAAGNVDPTPWLADFYSGENGLTTRISAGLDAIDARSVSEISFPKWDPYVIRVGKYGPYTEIIIDEERSVASIPDDLAPGDVTAETLAELIKAGNEADKVLGIHPEHELPVILKRGPYGYYMQLGDDEQAGKPKRVSLTKGLKPADVDLAMGVSLLSLPRELGVHPESGLAILANVGRFGPYVKHGSTFASLPVAENVLTVGLETALELIAKKAARSKALRSLGAHPESGEQIEIFEGRYGPYVKHQKTNASLPKGMEQESLTLEEAVELLAARELAKPTKKKKKAPAKKKPSAKKKAAAKKKPAAKKKK